MGRNPWEFSPQKLLRQREVDLVRHATVLKVLVLVLNVAVVAYLIYRIRTMKKMDSSG